MSVLCLFYVCRYVCLSLKPVWGKTRVKVLNEISQPDGCAYCVG
ncbi:hypothetical protein DZA65_00497 [Dickeya dianthicola]|nr:hypothetical protein DZA65_00497 [Dickeya dianthicola]